MRTESIERTIIEENEVFGLALKTPLFVINGRTYYCSGRRIADPNTFFKNNKRYRIEEGPCLEVLEEISNKKLERSYLEYKNNFIKEELEKIGGGIYGSDNQEELAIFAVKEIFPYLRRDQSGSLDNLFGVVTNAKDLWKEKREKQQKEKIETLIESRIRDLRYNNISQGFLRGVGMSANRRAKRLDVILLGTDLELSKSSENNSLLLELVGGFNFAINEGNVYVLNNAKKEKAIEINGNKYVFSHTASLREFQRTFAQRRINELSVQSLENIKDNRGFHELISGLSEADELCKREKYNEKDFGFEKRSNGYLVVYVKVPDYVLKSPHDSSLYEFKGHKIGIEIKKYTGEKKPVLEKNPFSLRRVAGPFYSSDSNELCMGTYTKGYFNKMPFGKACAKFLIDARNVVLNGYKKGSNPYRFLNQGDFSSRRISKAEVNRRKLQITNVNYASRDRWIGDIKNDI